MGFNTRDPLVIHSNDETITNGNVEYSHIPVHFIMICNCKRLNQSVDKLSPNTGRFVVSSGRYSVTDDIVHIVDVYLVVFAIVYFPHDGQSSVRSKLNKKMSNKKRRKRNPYGNSHIH